MVRSTSSKKVLADDEDVESPSFSCLVGVVTPKIANNNLKKNSTQLAAIGRRHPTDS